MTKNKENHKKTGSLQSRRAIILIVAMLFINLFLMNFASAEKIEYSNQDLKVEVYDTIVFGLIKTTDIGSFELKSSICKLY